MEFKGTKGELKIIGEPYQDETYDPPTEYHGAFEIKNQQGEIFSQVHAYSFWGITFERAEANAKLIAAAPELLEALNGLLKVVGGFQLSTWEEELSDMANKAINKALK